MEENTMTFICEDMCAALFEKLYEQRKSSRFCDLTLYVNNKIIKAHRNVLACSSPYFDSILKHHHIIKEQLTVNCLDSDIFNVILKYMYTGHITIQQSNVEELLRLADHFIITKLIEYCIEFLGTKLSLENCLFTYYLTQRFKLKHLGSLVENWIVSHINEVCEGKEILNLDAEELQDFLNHKSFAIPVYKTLNILSEWALKSILNREQDYKKMLNCIEWHNLDHNVILGHLDMCILYTKSDVCLYYFLYSLMENNLLLPNFKSKYEELQLKYEQLSKNENKCSESEQKSAESKITVIDNGLKNGAVLVVKSKQKRRKQQLLKKLILYGLKPSLRMTALKTLICKNDKGSLSDIDDCEEEHEEKNGVKCPICFTQINDSLLLEQHLALSHAKDVTYKCGICTYVCQYHGDYLNHMKNHFSGPPYKCDYCDTSAEQISKLISHRSKHLEESVYQCTSCSFKCRLKQNFLNHIKLHNRDHLYKCENCTKTFKMKQNLESHMLTHSNDKNLHCEACGFHTKFLSHMIAHKRIHTGDLYRCSYPHCKYSTSKKNQLVSHSKTHNGVRPHTCGVCGRGFMEKSHLVRHERIHLEEKPFKCSNCDYASSRRDKLKEHFTRHHGENASAKVPYKARPMRNTPKPKTQPPQETPSVTVNANNVNYTPTNNNNPAPTAAPPLGSEIQDLIMHHQTHPPAANNMPSINPNYHHFGDPPDFHHHGHTHNIQHQILSSSHNQRPSQHQNSTTNHHMLTRSNLSNSTATSTAAAVAAAMMLDPRFHHNSAVPYHATSTPVSMAMAAVQSSQQIQGTAPHGEYPPSLQNCMTLF